MRQLLLRGSRRIGDRVELSGDDYHYLARVLRKGVGDRVVGLDEAGCRWVVEIVRDTGTSLVATVGDQADRAPTGRGGESVVHDGTAPAPRFPAITVYQAIPKGRKLDEVIRQLVQFGVTSIRPIVTSRSVVRPDGGGHRTERWERIAREAVQQSGAERAVEVAEPVGLESIASAPGALSLLLHPEPLAQTTLHGYLGSIPDEIELVVGPEGGLCGEEIEELGSRGFQPLWLGPQVLRSESAALFAAAAIRILILERTTWRPAEM